MQVLAPIANYSKRALNDEEDDAMLLNAVARLGERIPRPKY